MNRYRAINLETNEIICEFYTDATDLEGIMRNLDGYANGNLPWHWELQRQVFGKWKSFMTKRSSQKYEAYINSLPFWKRLTGIGIDSFEKFSTGN